MPEQPLWEGFFDAARVLSRLELTDTCFDVADFGCGYGTFAIAAARLTSGTVHAIDIEPEMVNATAASAEASGVTNVRASQRDFITEGSGLPNDSVGYVMLFNILHAEDPMRLLREAHRILQPGGGVGVIHWVCDAETPRGPDLSIRPRPEQCRAWIQQAGFGLSVPFVALPPYHYGLVGRRAN